ncbi:MAG: hypothetical protein UV74_C0010G0004 [Candidatus Woesebacteria bacterium GW2011_GWB1_43_14]|uniref:Uncharacterized protein n=2 Tax=Candidatus Woeseibacteriota TaxID=1752722 RepID=A0A0G0LXJ4_9BACT|nr:MAG: hypothetical protein UT23_C0027G0007 [Candidatus Woesebacteria bacterium GW2011_GWA1_39_12]KKS97712.1 MAG: hypothetical protein UV74_C0010G0004 [Candidatus Woesebacteria bacterium GW2011_GWB1_43_14]
MEKIFYKKTLIGIRIKKIPKGSVPLTDGKEPLQLVSLKHPKGSYLKAHIHEPKKRVTRSLQECLIVKKGKIRLDLYGRDKKKFKRLFLKAGESFILMNGGIGIHLLEDSECLEVKNGPFVEDKVLI